MTRKRISYSNSINITTLFVKLIRLFRKNNISNIMLFLNKDIPTVKEIINKLKLLKNFFKTKKSAISDEVIESKLPFTYGDNSRSKYCEFLVSRYLNTLNKDYYTIIDNVTLPSMGGNTTNTQIDHVVVSRYGIFCIETKSHRGWIYCMSNEQSWLQILPKSCNEFYSPSKQNYAHMSALKSLLRPRLVDKIVSIIVFTSADAIIKDGDVNVGNIGYMLREIDKHKTLIYSRYEYEKIVNIIRRANKNDKETAYQHKIEISNLVTSLTV